MTSSGEKELLSACKEGDRTRVGKLLYWWRRVNVNCKDEDGRTPLYLASWKGHADTVQKLLTVKNVDLTIPDNIGLQPIHASAQFGHINVISLLLSHGADINTRASLGQTPVYQACVGGELATVKWLISEGADTKLTRHGGRNLLHAAAKEGHISVSQYLLELGFGVTVQDEDGQTPLHMAAYQGHTSVISILLQAGADPQLSENDDFTPLHWAAQEGHPECLSLLLPISDINKQNKNKTTPLILACNNGQEECTELLLEAGADTAVTNKWGYDALGRAAEEGFDQCVLLLLKHGAEVRWDHEKYPLKLAQVKGHTSIVTLLEDYRVNYSKYELNGATKQASPSPPTLTALKDVIVTEGEDINVSVDAHGKPEPRVVWFLQEEELVPDRNTKIQSLGTRKSLTIRNASLEHTGRTLAVVATNEAGETRRTAQIKVTERPLAADLQETTQGLQHVFDICRRFVQKKQISAALLNPAYDVCFCVKCHRDRGDGLVYLRGDPPKKYGLPIGWCKFGLVTKPQAASKDIFNKWHVAFHGTQEESVQKIIESGDMLLPGDTTPEGNRLAIPDTHFDPANPNMLPPKGHDVNKFYFSPSIRYSGCEVYAKAFRWTDPLTKIQHNLRVAFQVRIEPGKYDIGQQTIGAKGEIDPLFTNKTLEWSTARRFVSILVGLLVKVDDVVGDSISDMFTEISVSRVGSQKGATADTSYAAEITYPYIHVTDGGREVKLSPGEKCLVLNTTGKTCRILHPAVNEPIDIPVNYVRKS